MPGSKSVVTVLRVALASLVLAVFTYTRADPDLWGHVRFGQDTVAERTVHLPDRYSFASDRPWINHEWLSEAVMYGAYAAGGGAGLIALKVLLLGAMLAVAAATWRAAGLPAARRDLLLGLLLVGTAGQSNHVRPQLFSLALFAWLLAILMRSDRSSARRAHGRTLLVFAVVPMMALWTNVHGGWLVGAGTLAVWAGLGLLTPLAIGDKLRMMCAAVAALAATLLNPYGWRLWLFMRETVGFGRADITEWQPGYRLGYGSVLLWALVASAAVLPLARSSTRRSIDRRIVGVVIMFGVASFRVDRLLSFFAIAVTVLLGPHIAAALRRSEPDTRESTPARLATALSMAVAAAVLVGSATIALANMRCVRMEPELFPEPEVTRAVIDANLHGRMLTWFDWGEYAIWHFWPALTVSFDGRRETVYSNDTIQRQLRLYANPSDRRATMELLRPDYVWLPSTLPLSVGLLADGWKPLVSGSRSVLLTKQPYTLSVPVTGQATPRCFPGP